MASTICFKNTAFLTSPKTLFFGILAVSIVAVFSQLQVQQLLLATKTHQSTQARLVETARQLNESFSHSVPVVNQTSKLKSLKDLSDEIIRAFFNEPVSQSPSVPDDPKKVKSLIELRNVTSKMFDLENSIAIFRSITGTEIAFPQNFWKQGVPPMGCYRDLYDEFFETIQPQNRCALVGSSGILLNSTCGKEIDDHDFIMRSNIPPLSGYEKDVGKKTHLIAISHLVVGYMDQYFHAKKSQQEEMSFKQYYDTVASLNDTILWFPGNMSWQARPMRDAERKLINVLSRIGNFRVRAAYSPVPLYPQMVNRFWKKSSSSEGFVLLTLATLFCAQIDLYGYWPHGQDLHGNNVTHHYFDSISLNQKTIPREFQILSQLNATGVIRLNCDRCTN